MEILGKDQDQLFLIIPMLHPQEVTEGKYPTSGVVNYHWGGKWWEQWQEDRSEQWNSYSPKL